MQNAKVLCVGAGGIGCELLKTLVLTGFEDTEVVRMCVHLLQRHTRPKKTILNTMFCRLTWTQLRQAISIVNSSSESIMLVRARPKWLQRLYKSSGLMQELKSIRCALIMQSKV